MTSLRSVTVLTRARHRSCRTNDVPMDLALPVLPPLSDQKGWPLTDTEILLGRLLVEIDRREQAGPRPLLAYLIGESGIRPVESTALTGRSLNDPHQPTTITSPGLWEFGKRTIKPTKYAAATLPELLADLETTDARLTYIGRTPRSKQASASLSPVITRFLRRAGVHDRRATAKSLSLWRVHKALVDDQDMRKARRYHGGATLNVLEDLKLRSDEHGLLNDEIYLYRRDTDEHVATVPAHTFYDSSVTRNRRRRKAA